MKMAVPLVERFPPLRLGGQEVGWIVFRPSKQSGTFMPTPLDEGATTAGVPRHYAHSYERCRTPQPSLASSIPIWREVSAGDAAGSEGVHLIH